MDQRKTTLPAAATPAFAAPQMGLDMMLAWNRPMLRAFADLTSHSLQNGAAMSAAWTTLMQKRMEQGLALPQRVAACRSPEELLHVYSEWAKLAAAHYQEGFAALSQIGQEMSRETAEVVSESFNGATHSLARHAA